MPVMLLPFALVSALVAPAAPAAASTPSAIEQAEAEEKLFIQIQIKNGKKTLKHPGSKMETGEEVTLVLNEGKTKHEVMVFVGAAESGYDVEVVYTAGGKKRVEAKESVKGKGRTKFKSADGKSVVTLTIKGGKERAEGVDLPDGDDPLDGL